MTFNCLSPVLIEEPVFLPHLHFHLYQQTSLEIKNLYDGIWRSCKSVIRLQMLSAFFSKSTNKNTTITDKINHFLHQCTMIPLLTRSCLKSSKLRPILNGQFCHAISKNIGLKVLGSKQPREILVFVILKL